MGSSAVRRFQYQGLPDIVAVNNEAAVLLSIEAKSGTGDVLYVRPDQLQRCLLIRDMFGYYKTKHVILAFKFMRKKRFARKNLVVYEKRKLIEYYKIADKLHKSDNIPFVKCRYSGKTYVMSNGKFANKNLPDYICHSKTEGRQDYPVLASESN